MILRRLVPAGWLTPEDKQGAGNWRVTCVCALIVVYFLQEAGNAAANRIKGWLYDQIGSPAYGTRELDRT